MFTVHTVSRVVVVDDDAFVDNRSQYSLLGVLHEETSSNQVDIASRLSVSSVYTHSRFDSTRLSLCSRDTQTSVLDFYALTDVVDTSRRALCLHVTTHV